MHRSWPQIIAHADLDAFYAAVEQLDDPALRGQPVIVGPPSRRGVVLTASYEARPFGVGSAMPMLHALRRCPQAIVVPPRFERYSAISAQVMAVFRDFSPRVEAISLDEAFLDMSGSEHFFGPPAEIGQRIRAAVREATGLAITVGVAGTKYVAKVASGFGKPDGLVVVEPERSAQWLAPLPVARLWGAGPKMQARLVALGFVTIGDIAAADRGELVARLGSAGSHFHDLARGIDPRPVARRRVASSIGSDRTLEVDVRTVADIERHLLRSADRVGERLRRKGLLAAGVRVRLKTAAFRSMTRQCQLAEPTDSSAALFAAARALVPAFRHPGPFRLVGMAAFDLAPRDQVAVQPGLFGDPRRRNLEGTLDAIAAKFGNVMHRARDLGPGGTVARNGPNLDAIDEGFDD